MSSQEVAALKAEIAALRAEIAPVLALAVRRDSRKEQARKAGCSVQTLRNRERRLSAKLRMEGGS